jgi:WD40 repeat protein
VLSADGRSFLAGCSDGKAYLFDSASGAQLQVFSGQYSINTMAFSPDGTLVLIGNSNNDALLYQTASGQLLHTLHGHIAPLLSVAFSPDGKSILTGGWDNTARLWDTASGNLEHIFSGQNGAVLKALFSPDGKSIFTGGKNGEIRAWRIPDNRLNLADPAARFEAGAVVGRLLPDNQSILLLLEDPETAIPTLRFVQGASGNVLQTIKVPRLLNADLSPDGKTALITRTTETGSLTQLFNIQTGQAVPQFTPIKDIQSALFSPDGSMLVSQDNDGSASIWNAKTGENLHRYIESVLYYYVTEAWSPDSKSFLVADTSGIVHLYDTQAYLEIKAFGTPSDASGLTNIFTTAFSPDGGSVLLGGSDGGVRLWDIHKGTLIREYKGHTDQVYSVAFSPDGKFILTASLDKTVRLWEANTGKLIRVLSHKYYVGKARFSPDGKFILSSSFDGVHLWDSDYHDTIRAACSLLIRDLTPEERAQYDITGSEPTCPAH